ncbi:hypothetical protein [Vibrio parahaemolyticus]|uniref:hypothetical protein n=1 Tax=Vibrio parahaemolyticus TaxID=670 RepID=UPI00232ECB17|nr:hypothetical protein [Vibrio parahaemolyticus]MDB6195746.1 hypothetical protein [Vibrio parahaemolyticus]
MNFFSNNFKVFWWAVIVLVLGVYFWHRFPDLVLGKAVTADMLVFVVWIAVCLVPFFNQFEFFGLKIKAQIEEAKQELQGQINILRNEVSNSNSVDVKPSFWVGTGSTPASDEKLAEMEQKIDKVVKATEAGFGYEAKSTKSTAIDPDIMYLFETRYQIEAGLRNLARLSELNIERRPFPLTKIIYHLVENELLPSELGCSSGSLFNLFSSSAWGHTQGVSKSN